MSSLDQTFRVLSDRTRLRILNLLSQGEQPVGDIIAVMDASQSSVSQHLAALKAAGLVSNRQQGRRRFYSLRKPRSRIHAKVIACLHGCFGDVAAFRKDVSRLQNLRPRLKPLPAPPHPSSLG
jgi:DNA-binding transcriptional ArsR family regulator